MERLGDLPTEVVEHSSDPSSPWQGYRLCLEQPTDATHICVIQDDAIPCLHFAGALHRFCLDVPVCLFLPNMPMKTRRHARNAIHAGERWIELQHSDWVPVVAVVWPMEKITQFLRWVDTAGRRKLPETSDDAMVGRWMRSTAQRVVATLPSLVQHPDDVESTWRRNRHPRTALWFIGDLDPLALEW